TIEVASNVVPFLRSQRRGAAEDVKKSFNRHASESWHLCQLETPAFAGVTNLVDGSPRLRASASASFTAPFPGILSHLAEQLPTLRHLAASYLYRSHDVARIERLDALAKA